MVSVQKFKTPKYDQYHGKTGVRQHYIRLIQHCIDKLCQNKELLNKKRFQAWIWLTTLFISVIPFMVDGYNPTNIESWCWIQPNDSSVMNILGMKLEKEQLNTFLRISCFYGWLLATFLWLFVTYLVINCCAPYNFYRAKKLKIWFSRIIVCNICILTVHWSFPLVRRGYNALNDGQDFKVPYNLDSCIIQAIFVDLYGVGNLLGSHYIIYQYQIVFGNDSVNDSNTTTRTETISPSLPQVNDDSDGFADSSASTEFEFSHFSTSTQQITSIVEG